MLTERVTAVQSGGEAAGVGVGRNVGGGGVQHGVSDDDGVDDALTGDGAERHGRLVRRPQRHHLTGDEPVVHRCVAKRIVYSSCFGSHQSAARRHASGVGDSLEAPEQAAL